MKDFNKLSRAEMKNVLGGDDPILVGGGGGCTDECVLGTTCSNGLFALKWIAWYLDRQKSIIFVKSMRPSEQRESYISSVHDLISNELLKRK